MNSSEATVTTKYDSTDSTATRTNEGSKPVTDCKLVSGNCLFNNKVSCWCCRCVKAGKITNRLTLKHGQSMNNKHIRNTSLTSNTITINHKSSKVLPNQLANLAPPHGNQINHSAASHAFTFSDKPVSDCKPVFNCCRYKDKSSCQCCRCVKVGKS